MDFYDKFVDRFQNLSKVKNSVVQQAEGLMITYSFQKKMFCHIDHALLESSS